MPAKDKTDYRKTQTHIALKVPIWPERKGNDSQSTISANKSWLRWCLMLIILLTVPDFIAGLKDVSVTIPQAVKRGSNALLICNYDMENDTLYSVKWYKGRREFYRYTPKENPAMKVFPMAAAGLNVERNLSNQSHVVLLAVPLNISGKFTCEISVEAPTFQTAMVSGELEVVELPEEQAIVTGIQPRYRIGDLVDGNCSIKYSKPAANLTWTINGVVVPLHHIKTYQTERYEENNLESVVSALHFMVTTQHFVKGQMRLKCTASIFDIFKEEIESVIEEDRPRIMASGRSYDMHNNYPYEQHASGDGFEDHNESFLTYSAADITSSATTIHTNIYARTFKTLWKHIWTCLTASMAAIRIFSYLWKQPTMEALELRSVKRISEARHDEEEGKVAKALQIFVVRESVAYISAIIFTTIFLRALTRHFISCQRMRKKSTANERERAALPTLRHASTIAAQLTSNMLPSKLITATTAAATKSTTAATVIVERTLKGRKSFHNCVVKNLKSLSVRLVGLLCTLFMIFMLCAVAMVNPLQKLQLLKEQEQQKEMQHPSRALQRHEEAHLQRNTNEQLSLTVADGSSTPPLTAKTTCNVLTFDTKGASATMHTTPDVHSSNHTCNAVSGSGNHHAIANFTKDTSKDQILLMMIVQGFDCQHVDDFVTLTHCVDCERKEQQQKALQQPIKNYVFRANSLTVYWQEKYNSTRFCCCNC